MTDTTDMAETDYVGEISNIKLRIERINRDRTTLEKRVALKKKHGMFDGEEAIELDGLLGRKSAEIAALQGKIRTLENEAIRSRNLSGR